MKGSVLAGIALIVIGGLLVAKNIKFSTRENVVDAGPIQIDKKEQHTIPTWAGWIVLGAGVVTVVAGASKKS